VPMDAELDRHWEQVLALMPMVEVHLVAAEDHLAYFVMGDQTDQEPQKAIDQDVELETWMAMALRYLRHSHEEDQTAQKEHWQPLAFGQQ
jgi:hypothetical protein